MRLFPGCQKSLDISLECFEDGYNLSISQKKNLARKK